MRSRTILTVVFYLALCLSLQWQRIDVSALDIHRLLQTKYDKTSQNIRLDFSGDGSPGVFSKNVQVEIEKIATGILTNDLSSDITLVDTMYAASTEKPTVYLKVQLRHPSYLTPSIQSFLLVAFRDNASDFIDYLSSFDEYSDINSCDVSTFDSFDNLTDVVKPTLRPSEVVQITPQPVASGTKELTVHIQLRFEGATAAFSESMQDSIISIWTSLLNNYLDKDIELVSISPLDRRKLQNSIGLPLVITVIHPKWMTSTYARSLVMLALNNSSSELYAEVSNDETFSSLLSISLDESFDEEATVTTVPSHAPSPSLNTISTPILSPTTNRTDQNQSVSTHDPVVGRKTDTFPITLIFVGVSSDEHLSSDSKIFIQNSISTILNQHVDPDIDLVELSVIPNHLTPARRRRLDDWFGLTILITLRYTIDTGDSADVSEHIASILATNIDDMDTIVLRETEGFHELQRIEVISAGINLTADDSSSNDTGSEVAGESLWDLMPSWTWITIASGIGAAIITTLVLRFVCCKHEKENNVQLLWTHESGEYAPRMHNHLRRRPSIRHLPNISSSRNHTRRLQGSRRHSKRRRLRPRKLERPPPTEDILALPPPPKQCEHFLALPPPLKENQIPLALPPPPKEQEKFLALPCPERQDIVPALLPPPAPLVRRPSAISALSVSIYAEETRIVPYNHPDLSDPEQSIPRHAASSRCKRAPDPDGFCY